MSEWTGESDEGRQPFRGLRDGLDQSQCMNSVVNKSRLVSCNASPLQARRYVTALPLTPGHTQSWQKPVCARIGELEAALTDHRCSRSGYGFSD